MLRYINGNVVPIQRPNDVENSVAVIKPTSSYILFGCSWITLLFVLQNDDGCYYLPGLGRSW